MKPVNSKSLLHFLCDQMEKLDNGSVTIEQSKAQANLAKQVSACLRYENDRARVLMEIEAHNKEHNGSIELRNIELKDFDNV